MDLSFAGLLWWGTAIAAVALNSCRFYSSDELRHERKQRQDGILFSARLLLVRYDGTEDECDREHRQYGCIHHCCD